MFVKEQRGNNKSQGVTGRRHFTGGRQPFAQRSGVRFEGFNHIGRVDAEPELGMPLMLEVEETVDVGKLTNDSEPAILLATEKAMVFAESR